MRPGVRARCKPSAIAFNPLIARSTQVVFPAVVRIDTVKRG